RSPTSRSRWCDRSSACSPPRSEADLVDPVRRLLLGVPLEHQLIDETRAGEPGEVQVVLRGLGRLLVVVDVQAVDSRGGVLRRVALELELVDQAAAREGGEVQVGP